MGYQVVPPGGSKNTGPEMVAVDGVSTSIAFVLVILRFYVRARMAKNLWWDDFFLLLGMLFSITGLGITVAGVNSGYGQHLYDLSPKQIFFALEMEIIMIPVVNLSTMFTKISICLLLLRVFTTNRAWKRAIYLIIALIVVTSGSSAIFMFPQCRPIARLWNPTIKGTCWRRRTQIAIYYYQGGVAIFTDFLLAFLPIYFLKDVQISFRNKLSIVALMSLGVFTGICAINRTWSVSQLNWRDITYSSKNLIHWIALEKNVAIIAAAIPALRPLWARKSASQNQKTYRHARLLNETKRHPNSPYGLTDPQMEADSTSSRLESRITAHGSGPRAEDMGSEAQLWPLPRTPLGS